MHRSGCEGAVRMPSGAFSGPFFSLFRPSIRYRTYGVQGHSSHALQNEKASFFIRFARARFLSLFTTSSTPIVIGLCVGCIGTRQRTATNGKAIREKERRGHVYRHTYTHMQTTLADVPPRTSGYHDEKQPSLSHMGEKYHKKTPATIQGRTTTTLSLSHTHRRKHRHFRTLEYIKHLYSCG